MRYRRYCGVFMSGVCIVVGAKMTLTRYLFLLQMVTRTKKIFVGGLSAPSTLEDVKNYFEQFGRVSASEICLCFALRDLAHALLSNVLLLISSPSCS